MNSTVDPEEDQHSRTGAEYGPIPHNLNDITGINPEQEAAHEREAIKGARQDIAEREGFFNKDGDSAEASSGATDGGSPKGGKAAAALSGAALAAAESGDFFNGSDPGPGGKVRQLVRGKFGRKAGVGTGIVGALLGSGVFFSTILSGPAQLIHLSHILQRPFGNEQSATTGRTTELVRWARTGDYGETRLGTVGHFINKSVQADFTARGITIKPDKFGLLKTVSIDATKNPEYEGLSRDEQLAAIAKDNNIDTSKIDIHQIREGKFAFNLSDSTISGKRAVIGGLVDQLGYGKIMSAIKFRQLTKYYNIPSWLHPLDRAAAGLDAKLANTDAVRAYQEKRAAKIQAKSDETIARNAAIKEKLKGTAGVTGALLTGSAVLCAVRDIAHAIPVLNYTNVIVPAIQSAGDGMAIGEQLEYGSQTGSTPSMAEAGAIVSNFRDKDGHSIWESKPLNALQDMQGGVDLSSTTKKDFSPDNTSASLESAIDEEGGAGLCSGLGQALQGVAGIALLAVGPGGWVVKSLTTAAGAAAITAVTSLVPKLLADKPVTGTPHQGPTGGSIDALGAKEAAYTAYRNDGAVAMNPKQATILDQQQFDLKQAQIRSESIATRIFDPNNENSFVGQTLNHLTPSYTDNLAIIADSLPKMGSGIFSSLASIVSPKAHAATPVNYDWPFPEYAFSQDDLNNPLFQDPYENGKQVGDLLNNGGPTYVQAVHDRAETCFGVNISKGTDGWDAVADNDTNTATADFHSANCADTSDPNWLRIRFFIFDTRTADALACYNGLTSSCEKLGVSADTSSAGASAIGETQWPFKADVNTNIVQCYTFHSGGNHPGVDIDAPRGTPVYAITAGTVKLTNMGGSGYGPYYVTVNADSPTGFSSGYGHMDTATVKDGQVVKVGDQVGTEGSQGESTGPHLHLNIFPGPYSGGDGPNIDPMPSLKIPPGSTNSAGCT